MHLTNRDVREIHAGLIALSGRVLPTLASDLKVAKLLREHFATPYAATEIALAALVRDLPAPPDATSLPFALSEAREARFREEVLDTPCATEFTIPDALYIVESDLPKALSGKDGDMNRAGIASIVAALGPLFKSA